MQETKPPVIVPGSETSIPVLPLRDVVVFPHMVIPLFVGRRKSIRALEPNEKAVASRSFFVSCIERSV